MIPVLRAFLPTAQQLSPYLEHIDRNQTYSNFGDLHCRLAQKLGDVYNVNHENVTLCSSGTTALQVCLLEIINRLEKKPSQLTIAAPNWTFSATIHSALSLGINVKLIDVDWQGIICKDKLKDFVHELDGVIVVAPFGAPIEYQTWVDFAKENELELVFDCAASFFTLKSNRYPSVLSMHATKGFSTGEGGAIITDDKVKSEKYKAISSFGFKGSRIPQMIGLNGKLSEYSCAIGLAMLEDIINIEEKLKSLAYMYDNAFSNGIDCYKPFSPKNFARNTYSIKLDSRSESDINLLINKFSLRAIEVRSWWGEPISDLPLARHCDASSVKGGITISKELSETVLGIPFGLHLNKRDAEHIITCTRDVIN